jgi:hypothetical protein
MSGAPTSSLAHDSVEHGANSRSGGGGLLLRDIGARRGLPKEPAIREGAVRAGPSGPRVAPEPPATR